ncbi:unnamed protein product [Orchesella dallaii]|uniref:MSP domain-containing protein n=1 Tax=Orchesella dallaii TaxID=48710 RepID=A0ABP1QG11_9HEXA
MDMITVLKHLIEQEACFPALKLVWDDQIDADGLGNLPKLTPSHYLNENRLTTDERHKLLCRQQKKMISRTPGAEVVVEPPIIVFQNYRFGESYSFPIVVRNISKNSQKVALLMDESYVFKFDECSQRVAKFPCGMCITATVTFTPESAIEDYYHKLVVSTNTKKVAVPIIGT